MSVRKKVKDFIANPNPEDAAEIQALAIRGEKCIHVLTEALEFNDFSGKEAVGAMVKMIVCMTIDMSEDTFKYFLETIKQIRKGVKKKEKGE